MIIVPIHFPEVEGQCIKVLQCRVLHCNLKNILKVKNQSLNFVVNISFQTLCWFIEPKQQKNTQLLMQSPVGYSVVSTQLGSGEAKERAG